ncbi:MAG TPA: 2-amino-4-hydroxy-6-hydroxymethyldihydropteridine diphosphokinase [Anaerolineae bacterium]|nr:2-amino-4-hydroxy-6-hydroxymethyldihydropteridine diphosphokinase [Anaerolineae bacterium]
MTDRIHIKDLLLRTIIGINDEERHNRQDVLINIELHASTHAAGASDDIADAVNYRTITKRVIALVEGSQFYLVEKMAAEIARICLKDPRVERATVRVEKPGALRFARSVGVEIERTRANLAPPNRAFISLGSNIKPEQNLVEGVRRLAERCRLLAASPVYETRPVGTLDQPSFLNAAVLVETDLAATDLKVQVLQPIEEELGRVRTQDKNAPRTIDLDISLFNEQIMEVGHRHIPDPEILQFPHIARPLADLAPEVRHPETGQTLEEIARSLASEGLVHRSDLTLWPESHRKLT